MSQNAERVKTLYAAFGRGDVATIVANLTDDVLWSFEANSAISWGGIGRGPQEAVGFFQGMAGDLADMKLEMTEFVSEGDVVASFGRFDATVKKNGRRVSTPVCHYFRFRDGKVAEYRNHINTAAFADAMTAAGASA
ncbi:MAG TPA: nuclear transport factor 2 family protein [Bryobacteraceae bacterium]|jgi:ketosteroid isomerase-like protein